MAACVLLPIMAPTLLLRWLPRWSTLAMGGRAGTRRCADAGRLAGARSAGALALAIASAAASAAAKAAKPSSVLGGESGRIGVDGGGLVTGAGEVDPPLWMGGVSKPTPLLLPARAPPTRAWGVRRGEEGELRPPAPPPPPLLPPNDP